MHEADARNAEADDFCRMFLDVKTPNRFVLGTNAWADSIGQHVEITGYIDDRTTKATHNGKPVLRMEAVPKDALVVSAVVGEIPITARRRLREAGLRNIDYYAFRKATALPILPVLFMSEFEARYDELRERLAWVKTLLRDPESLRVYCAILNFRMSGDLSFMQGFTNCQDRQYFEDFLELEDSGEVFFDVGGFDGYTSAEFIRRCPDYRAVHLFEPEAGNIARAKQRLQANRAVHYHNLGLSDRKQTLRFSAKGSASAITEGGEVEICVDRLDDVVDDPVTFVKMDIEGSECAALAGAQRTIADHHPRLAIAAYHKYDDFVSIPEQVFRIRDDYDLYMRHYTEGVTETVMFFMPRK